MNEEKKIFWLIENNADLSMTVEDIGVLKDIIEGDIEGVQESDIEEFQYTVTPVLMTQDEFDNLPEGD